MNQTLEPIINQTGTAISKEQLRYMAYTGQFETVNTIMRNLSVESRKYYSDKNILSQAIWGSIKIINAYREVHNSEAVKKEQLLLTAFLEQFINYSHESCIYSRELFQAILYVSDLLIQLSNYEEASEYLLQSIELGINKFPSLRTDAINKLALIDNNNGRIEQSVNHLLRLAEHPYLITDRNLIPEIFFRLSSSVLKKGEIERYKNLLFLGIRYFYTNTENRRTLIHQLTKTYRSSFKLVKDSSVKINDKLIYLLHRMYFGLPNFHKIKLGIINVSAGKLLLAVMYAFNYIRRSEPIRFRKRDEYSGFLSLYNIESDNVNFPQTSVDWKNKILITRAMGGIGDLLMMTPGIHALKRKYPQKEIHLAIPKRYFPIFKYNTDVKLLDIEEEQFSYLKYLKWYDFTDCPASRYESRKAPKIKKNRINIFARAMGINGLRLKRMNKRPRLFLGIDEKFFADEFISTLRLDSRPVIGVQLHSDETYRDFPMMEKLVKSLSENFTVFLFDSNKIEGYNFTNVVCIDSFGIREAFAIAAKCNLIIAPDSSFVHFAAAFSIPTIALFGPIDGKVRTAEYPECSYIDVRKQLGCLPCWRNESIPCKLTGMRNSACMESIPINLILKEVHNKLNK